MRSHLRALTLSCLVVFGAVGAVGVSAADNTLATAKDLYAAAAYEDALAVLNRLTTDSVTVDVAVQIAQYQSFCLFALGRTDEAETVARELIRKHPLRPLQNEEMSPRVETMFTQVRRQVLPPLIREKYKSGKAALDHKEFAAAETDLQAVQTMIAQAQTVGLQDESLTDLGLLAEGFLDLAHAAVVKAESAAVAPPPPAPVPSAAPPVVPAANRLYDASEETVVAPVAIRQNAPAIPPVLARLATGRRGVLELIIEADGSVSSAIMRESIHAQYDALVTRAARTWRYQPATKNGTAVRYLKAVALQVTE